MPLICWLMFFQKYNEHSSATVMDFTRLMGHLQQVHYLDVSSSSCDLKSSLWYNMYVHM